MMSCGTLRARRGEEDGVLPAEALRRVGPGWATFLTESPSAPRLFGVKQRGAQDEQ